MSFVFIEVEMKVPDSIGVIQWLGYSMTTKTHLTIRITANETLMTLLMVTIVILRVPMAQYTGGKSIGGISGDWTVLDSPTSYQNK